MDENAPPRPAAANGRAGPHSGAAAVVGESLGGPTLAGSAAAAAREPVGRAPAAPPRPGADLRSAGVASLATLGVYLLWIAIFGSFRTPDQAYFPELAAALLDGRLHLLDPPSTHDLTWFDGHWYVPFPPLAALLMLPLVAALGSAGFSTVLFGAVFGALNAGLVSLLLTGLAGRGWLPADRRTVAWLTGLFAVGSVHWSMAVTGSVWFVGQVTACTGAAAAAALTVRAPLRAAAPLSGAALGLAALGRPDLVLLWPLLLGIAVQRHREDRAGRDLPPDPWRSRLLADGPARWAVVSLIPVAVAVLLLAGYNAVRFQNPLEFGYAAENVAPRLAAQLREYGQFNVHYLAQNVWSMLLAGPTWDGTVTGLRPDPRGMSLLLTTPALIYLWRARRPGPLAGGAWIALVLLLTPVLLYYNTGWAQFGYRFSLEFMVPIMVLLALGVRSRTGAFRLLVVAGVVVNALGAAWWL